MNIGDIYYNEPKSNFKKVNIGVIINFDPLTIGVYCKLITSGKEFKIYNIKSLAKAIGISDEKARATIALLEREGYIKRIPLKNENGKFNGYAYEVEAEPLAEDERSHAGTGSPENGVPRKPTTPKSGYPETTLPLNNRNNINLDNKENKKDNKENKDDLFIQFWNTYNKKVGQIPALRAWKKLTADDKRKAIEGIKPYQESMHFDKHYIKHPATYLNQRTWEDDFTDYNSKSFYEIREDDTDKEKRFKEHMRKKHPAIEQVRCPLSMCAYIDLANVYGSESVEQELTKIENNIALYKLSDISYEIAKSLEKGRI